MLNLFTAGFSRAAFNFDSVPLGTFPANLDFIQDAGPGGIVIGGGVTTTGAGTITSAGPNNAAGVWNRRNLFTYADSVQMSRGRHQLSFGVWFQRIQDNEDTASRQLGQATFSSLQKFLQGTVSTFQAVPSANELGWRSWLGAWYVEDVIRLRSNLTLEAGLRHEFNNGWNEVSGRAANYVTDANGILETAPRIAGSVYTANNATKLFGPRIGLAWDPWGNGQTALRVGFGTYYSQIDDLSFLLNSLPPWNGAVSFSNVSLPSLLPLVPGAAQPPSCGPGVPTPCTTYAPQGVQANAKTPTVEEWNFTLEQALGRAAALRVSYVGSFGYHGLLSIDANSIAAQICQNTAGCAAGGVGTTKSTVSEGMSYIPVGSRPNPYLSGGFFWETEGNTSYNALQIDVRRRLANGLQIRGDYTWSKSLDMNSALTGAQANNQAQMIMNRNDPGVDWGPSALNVEHQATLSGSYELPFGHGRRWAADARGLGERLVGGWQFNAIVTLLSGFPFTPQVGSNRSGDGDTRNPDRPSLNSSFTGPVIIGIPSGWFNPAAFSMPTAGTYGSLGRGVYSGPGLANLDTSLFKNLALGEARNLQFRAEFFNVLNRSNFGTPNAIVFSNGAVSPSAGLITTTATTSRQIQFGLKLVF